MFLNNLLKFFSVISLFCEMLFRLGCVVRQIGVGNLGRKCVGKLKLRLKWFRFWLVCCLVLLMSGFGKIMLFVLWWGCGSGRKLVGQSCWFLICFGERVVSFCQFMLVGSLMCMFFCIVLLWDMVVLVVLWLVRLQCCVSRFCWCFLKLGFLV